MSLNWIDGSNFEINTMLMFDRMLIRVLADNYNWPEVQNMLRIVLIKNPHILGYLVSKCPERKAYFLELVEGDIPELTDLDVKRIETEFLEAIDTMVVLIYPSVMEKLDYIALWDEKRLLSMADFNAKRVLDIGSGTGRLTFAAAPLAKWIYAMEPVSELRDFMKMKDMKLKYSNVFVVDGTIEQLPFPDDTFDIVMSGHVMGDNYEAEYIELTRVLRSGGYIIDCPGEDERKKPNGPSKGLIDMGFEYSYYESLSGGDVYRYSKQIKK